MANYPTSLDVVVPVSGTTLESSADHANMHNQAVGSAVVALQIKLGVNASTPALNLLPFGVGAGSSTWGSQGTAITLVNSTFNNGTIGTPAITGGTYNSGVFGTPTISGSVISTGTTTGIIFGAAIAPGAGTITDSAGGTFVVNAAAAQIYYSALGTAAGNRTIGTPSNPIAYQQLTYAFKTSGSANGTLVWSPIFRLSQGVGTPALGTGVTWNYFGWRYNAIDSKYDFMGQTLNLI